MRWSLKNANVNSKKMSKQATVDDSVTWDALSWSGVLAEAIAKLKLAGVDAAESEVRRMVAEVTATPFAGLHRLYDDHVTSRALARFDFMLARRGNGEPLQYVLGRWGFRNLDLMLDGRVLIPRSETEMVAGLAIAAAQSKLSQRAAGGGRFGIGHGDSVERAVRVADLGTGSGALALSVALECAGVLVYATDCSVDALAVAAANLAGLGSAATTVTLHQGNWFEGLPDELCGNLDVIVSNPPYVSENERLPPVVADWEPEVALRAGADGLAALRKIVDEAQFWLAPDGVLVLETAPHQADTVARWCKKLGGQVTVHDDLGRRPRAVVTQR